MMLKHARTSHFVKYEDNKEIFPTVVIGGKEAKGIDALRELSTHLDYIE